MSDGWVAQDDLFTDGTGPVGAADPGDEVRRIAAGLPASVRFGTSSWSFPGWGGVVWDRPAEKTVLSRHGLAAYARHPLLRTVGVDRSYYGPLDGTIWRRWASQVPDDFRFVIKADRAATDPSDPRFLDPGYARDAILAPAVEGLGTRLAVVLFQFSPVPARRVGGPRRFAESLYRFLSTVREALGRKDTSGVDGSSDRFPALAVELRTPALFTDDYVEALRHAGAVPGYVAHPRATSLADQLEAAPPGDGSGPFILRWMLRSPLHYEEARDRFHPFDRLQSEDPEVRTRIATAVAEAADAGRPVFVIVNNKAEGSSPLSVVELARAVAEGNAGGEA